MDGSSAQGVVAFVPMRPVATYNAEYVSNIVGLSLRSFDLILTKPYRNASQITGVLVIGMISLLHPSSSLSRCWQLDKIGDEWAETWLLRKRV